MIGGIISGNLPYEPCHTKTSVVVIPKVPQGSQHQGKSDRIREKNSSGKSGNFVESQGKSGNFAVTEVNQVSTLS